jgi:hypothetical protein
MSHSNEDARDPLSDTLNYIYCKVIAPASASLTPSIMYDSDDDGDSNCDLNIAAELDADGEDSQVDANSCDGKDLQEDANSCDGDCHGDDNRHCDDPSTVEKEFSHLYHHCNCSRYKSGSNHPCEPPITGHVTKRNAAMLFKIQRKTAGNFMPIIICVMTNAQAAGATNVTKIVIESAISAPTWRSCKICALISGDPRSLI